MIGIQKSIILSLVSVICPAGNRGISVKKYARKSKAVTGLSLNLLRVKMWFSNYRSILILNLFSNRQTISSKERSICSFILIEISKEMA